MTPIPPVTPIPPASDPNSSRGELVAGQFTPGLDQPSAVAPGNDLLEEKIYIADTGNNRVVCVRLPATDSPVTVWNTMKGELALGNTANALTYFSSGTVEGYRKAFLSIGSSELASMFSQIPAIIPIYIENETAQYRFEQVFGGITLSFPINFVKENGTWKIVEF